MVNPQYEYKVVQSTTPEAMETRLNELAQQGYRLIQFLSYDQTVVGGISNRISLCAIMERTKLP